MGVGSLLMLNSDTGVDRIAHVYPFTLSHIPGRVRIIVLSDRELRFSFYICSIFFSSLSTLSKCSAPLFVSALISSQFYSYLHVQRLLSTLMNLVGCSPWGRKESDTAELSTERSSLTFIPCQSSCVSAAHSPVRKSLRSQLFSC